MTLNEIKASDKDMLIPSDIAEILGVGTYHINIQVAEDIRNGVNSLGFPVMKIGTRVKIPRKAFIKFMEGSKWNSHE